MPTQNLLKFPSGRNVKRLKQDAKFLAKGLNIPLHKALDMVAQQNGGAGSWSESVKVLSSHSQIQHVNIQSPLAEELGITDDDLELLSWETEEYASDDGLIYSYALKFDESCPPETLERIEGLSGDRVALVSVNAFDEAPAPSEIEPLVLETDMNPYRKLLVLGLNELLARGLLSLEWDGKSNEETAHIEAVIAGHNTIVTWSGIGHGEVRISVWWKYDHSNHPQANSPGNARETFSGNSPLARRKHFPKFVGAVCSAWLERQEGKYLQGIGTRALIELYVRKGDLDFLKKLPNPVPKGYQPEGRFHM